MSSWRSWLFGFLGALALGAAWVTWTILHGTRPEAPATPRPPGRTAEQDALEREQLARRRDEVERTRQDLEQVLADNDARARNEALARRARRQR